MMLQTPRADCLTAPHTPLPKHIFHFLIACRRSKDNLSMLGITQENIGPPPYLLTTSSYLN